jgi:P-type Ca2+ transporter type 2C
VSAVLWDDAGERPFDDQDRQKLGTLIDEWAADGLRVLAVARRSTDDTTLPDDRDELVSRFERDMTLIGLVGIADPPRPEVAEAVAKARRAGLFTVMITGDHPLTARAIGQELGLIDEGDEVVTGGELDHMDEEELARRVEHIRVVARATARNKLRLIEALGRAGKVVAMTGDGVNDAPAIKAAAIGIAMGRSGTDVTREAADMVLADDNYATIVSAIEEGRKIYANIKRFIVFLFAANAGLVFAVFAAAMLGWPPILTPTQILWINLITNGLPALALGMEPDVSDPMNDPPRRVDAPIVDRKDVLWLTTYGTWMALLGLGVFSWYRSQSAAELEGEGLAVARTMTFTVLAFSPLFHALNSRSRRRSAFALGLFSNRQLWGAFVLAVGLQAIAVYLPVLEKVFGTHPLSWRELSLALALAASVWVFGELHKLALGAARSLRGTHTTDGAG